MTRSRKLWAGVTLSLVALAACDGSDGVLGNPGSQFGAAFATAFNADPNDAPQPSANLSIIYEGETGPSLTAAPIDI